MSITPQLERTTSRVVFLITDLDGVTALANLTSVLTTLTLTLYEKTTQTVVNNRNKQDVKNLNGFTLYDTPQTDPVTGQTYNVLGRLDPADNAMTRTAHSEVHVAAFEWTWGSPTRTGRGNIEIPVRNLQLVP